ncbi:unnamed protein product [Sphagnum troendelagicum]|uniref:Uncharacterized protein n=1 Tax=Sphagnum troendelagicum TaxID=128251 RepID=A0ABP0U464_9BRYO
MGIYFCRVGTDDGADTEPASGLISVFASHQSVFASGVCDQNLDDRTTTTIIIIILISFTCFSSLRQMMELSTEAAQATKTTLCTARELQKVEMGKNIHVSRKLMIRSWCPSRDLVLTNSPAGGRLRI